MEEGVFDMQGVCGVLGLQAATGLSCSAIDSKASGDFENAASAVA
eukprot:CAMPEP_0115706856 /NCGR_PEP_ID=MMETSP0272-20121206/71026_1 /TAXON_ID=71861 /ORGANISM="Scrippsiella trochoidea, Strain CCMP3099" /LENGTH=44 /DNA_ID= /DNA_START= /DNA_END= /DNA_ORIENTATION=